MRTYIKHYLPRRVTADTRAIVSGYEPQYDIMRAACRMLRRIDPGRPPIKRASPTPVTDVSPQLAAEEAEKQVLSAAMLSVFKEKRPTVCFLCLGDQSLPLEKRIYAFARPGDLTKLFKRKHLANIREADRIERKVCQMPLQHKMHLQNHAQKIHGTVS